MDILARITQHFHDSAETKMRALETLAGPLQNAAEKMVHCLMNDGKIMACGNGGSAADSQHFAAELVGRYERERPELAAIALTVDTSTLTAIAIAVFLVLKCCMFTSPLFLREKIGGWKRRSG